MVAKLFMQIRSYTVMAIGLALYAFGITAFISLNSVMGVYGKGFDQLKY